MYIPYMLFALLEELPTIQCLLCWMSSQINAIVCPRNDLLCVPTHSNILYYCVSGLYYYVLLYYV